MDVEDDVSLTPTALERLALYHGIPPQTASMRRSGDSWFLRGSTSDGFRSVPVSLDWHDPNTSPERAAEIALEVQEAFDANEAGYHLDQAAAAEESALQHPGPWHLLAEYHALMAQALKFRLRILNPTKEST
jgi:hypothetical protein